MLDRDSVTGETEPECWMYHQAEFLLSMVPAADQIGTDIDFFVLPPTDPSRPTPVIGTANFMSALDDRPEVREFMSFVASPEWGSEHMGRRTRRCVLLPQPALRPLELWRREPDPAADVRTSIADATLSALQSDAFRMDASDQMPDGDRGPDVGGWARRVLARDGRLGRRDPHHRAGLRRTSTPRGTALPP